jgi:thioesterase domain-containing protein
MAYANMTRLLNMDQPVYGLQAPGMEGVPENEVDVKTLATRYLDLIRAIQPGGPYRLAGHSLGGIICYEMARQLLAARERVALLIMIDAVCPTARFEHVHEKFMAAFMQALGASDLRDEVAPEADREMWTRLFKLMGGEREAPEALDNRDQHRALFIKRMVTFGFLLAGEDLDDMVLRRFLRSLRAGYRAAKAYVPHPLAQKINYFRSCVELPEGCHDPALGWSSFAEGGMEVAVLGGNHFDLFSPENVGALAASVQSCLDAVSGL